MSIVTTRSSVSLPSSTELDSLVRNGLPVIAVIGNDARWNALKFINSQGLFLNAHQAEELLDEDDLIPG